MYQKMVLKKKLLVGSMAAALMIASGNMSTVHAEGWADVLGGVIGGISAYDSALTSVLDAGNDARQQNQAAVKALKDEKLDLDDEETHLIDGIMNRLVTKGDYVMDSHSLPFRWQVTNEKAINAYCTPYNYISVYRGIILALNSNEDELAAVLGHEMTHGIQHHVAKNYAKSVLQRYGASYFNNLDGLTANLVAISLNYNQAKNFILPSEEAADEGGFFLAVDAGYNPGGMAAQQAKFLTMIKNKQMSESDTIFDPDDHPKTAHRLELAGQQLSEYGYNHVTVKDDVVYIDDKPLLTAEATSTLLPAEQAYMIAGAVAKGFHTNRLAAMWGFRTIGNRVEFLTNDPVYTVLKDAINKEQLGTQFEEMVTAAYHKDSVSGSRDKVYAKDKERLDKIKQQRQKELDKMKTGAACNAAENNADIYNSLNMPKLALMMADRIAAANPDEVYVHAIRGNSYATLGDYDKALAECNQALATNNQDPRLYISRAKAYKMMGKTEEALADCHTALKIDTNLSEAYKLQAAIFDANGSYDDALNSYKKYKYLCPKANDIPESYASSLQ